MDRGGGQRRGEIGEGREETGRTTNGLEVKKMIGGGRADEEGEIEVREGGVGRYCSCQASATICAGCSGRCRAVWRPVSPLQVYLAASFWPLQGRCKAVTLTPLLMVLLLWNMPSAIFKFCRFSSSSLQVAVSSCVVSNKNRNDTE